MNNWLKVSISSTPEKPLTHVPYHNVNRKAALTAFKRHWIQILEVIDQSKNRGQIVPDDITVVINHFAQTIDYLIVDLLHMSKTAAEARLNINENETDMSAITGSFPSDETEKTPIFDHFMSEQILQTVLKWSLSTGEFVNQMKLEQLKAYEKLLAQSSPEMLVYKPILAPLLGLLNSCSGCNPLEVEKRLLVLLNQLCVSLMNNPKLVEYFFHTSGDQGPTKFLIFSLLLPFVHREGVIGQHARDVLLLCMALSASYPEIGVYIAQHSNFCPVLATGLSGLYSMLPRSLPIDTDGWYRFSPDDVALMPALKNFINSLEFCNAVVQVSHPLVRQQIVEYIYQGFLVPVLGPALFQSAQEDLITALAYVELSLRTVTECQLQRAFLALLLVVQDYAELPLVTSLISHLHSTNVTLKLVTLSFFSTLLELQSEDAMILLIFQYLCSCNFVMLSQKQKLSQPPYGAAESFIRLIPSVFEAKSDINTEVSSDAKPASPISSFSDYLRESHFILSSSYYGCKSWTWSYDGESPSPSEAVRLIQTARIVPVTPYPKANSEPNSLPCSSLIEMSDRKRTRSLPDYDATKENIISSYSGRKYTKPTRTSDQTEEEKLDSLDGSSGYDSFNLKSSRDSSPFHNLKTTVPSKDDLDSISSAEFDEFLMTLENTSVQDDLTLDDEEVFFLQSPKTQLVGEATDSSDSMPWVGGSSSSEYEEAVIEDSSINSAHPKPTIGPFLEALLQQIDQFLVNSIHVGFLAMRCLSTLASYPTPLLTSLLLEPNVVLQPSVRSLYQVLSHLKMKIDDSLTSDDLVLLKQARYFLLTQFDEQKTGATSPPEISPKIPHRGDHKRQSLSRKMGAFFKWATSSEPVSKDTPLQNLADGSGYRYINRPESTSSQSPFSVFYSAPEEKRQAVLSAVVLQEWLLQLASLAAEHSVWCPIYRFPPMKFPPLNNETF